MIIRDEELLADVKEITGIDLEQVNDDYFWDYFFSLENETEDIYWIAEEAEAAVILPILEGRDWVFCPFLGSDYIFVAGNQSIAKYKLSAFIDKTEEEAGCSEQTT